MKYYLLLVEVFFLLLLSLTSSYGQSNHNELKFLAKNSDAIITGKVVQHKSKWNEDKTRIVTDALVEVDEYLKGNVNNKNIIVSYPGGEVDGIGEIYSHLPTLKDNEEVLLFIQKEKNNAGYKIFNGENGKIPLMVDKVKGEKFTPDNQKLSSIKEEIKKILTQE